MRLFKAANLIDGQIVTGIRHLGGIRTEWTPDGLSVPPPTHICAGINGCKKLQDCWRYIPAGDVLMAGDASGVIITESDKSTVQHYRNVRCWKVDFTEALGEVEPRLGKARTACDKARTAYDKAWTAYDKMLPGLHSKLLKIICTAENELHWDGERWG